MVPLEQVACKVREPDSQTAIGVVPVIVGMSVTVTSWDTEFEQPFSVTVYDMVVVPAERPDTSPPALSIPDWVTVATAVFELDQDPGMVLFANRVCDPTQTIAVPVIGATVGC